MAITQEGVFNVRNGIWTLVAAIAAKHDQLEFIDHQLTALQRGQIDLAASVQAIGERIPESRALFLDLDLSGVISILSLLVALLSFMRDAGDDSSQRVEQAIRQSTIQIEHVLSQSQQAQLDTTARKKSSTIAKSEPHSEGNRKQRRAHKFGRQRR